MADAIGFMQKKKLGEVPSFVDDWRAGWESNYPSDASTRSRSGCAARDGFAQRGQQRAGVAIGSVGVQRDPAVDHEQEARRATARPICANTHLWSAA